MSPFTDTPAIRSIDVTTAPLAARYARLFLASSAGRHAEGIRPTTASLRLVRQPEAGERHAGEADAEFLQRRAPRDGLGQALGEFIELVVHTFPFFCLLVGRFVAV